MGRIDANASICASRPTHGQAQRVYDRSIYIFQAPMSLPHPTTLTSIHASLPHFLPSPALASPVGSPSSQPNIAVSNAQCSTLFVANLGQFVSEHELKDIFSSVPRGGDITMSWCSKRLQFLTNEQQEYNGFKNIFDIYE
ncbi:Protein couch potato [Acromyrmex echinatior]|uniref:Protein couch potato n=1 Tax=Acromyrmex echinatior TaxID=103372 RepID=F4W3V1_ACREC|nr:Protein couch potato [Acromyrmex echinatior]